MKKLFLGSIMIILAVILYGTRTQIAVADGDIIENPANNHCYQLVTSTNHWLDWNQAKLAAEERGGYLATITSQAEQDFISNSFGSWIGWLGGRIDGTYDPTKLPSQQTWIWITGEPWSYDNWGGGQPSGWFGDGYEDRLEWSFGSWNDLRYYAVRPNLLVEFDHCFGFVTGSGWVDSPASYCQDVNLCTDASGMATFSFFSRYRRGQSTPMGNTRFSFTSGDFSFISTSYDWLVVNQAGTNAQFKGSGEINGAGDYKFMIWAGDETGTNGVDTFHIKIWYEDAGVEVIVYDNGSDQEIDAGNIQVHARD